MLDKSLRREGVRARVKQFIAGHNRMFPTNFAKFGDSPLVSLDEALFEDGSGTRGDNVIRGFWARPGGAGRRTPSKRLRTIAARLVYLAHGSPLRRPRTRPCHGTCLDNTDCLRRSSKRSSRKPARRSTLASTFLDLPQ
ncbi:hypothetical protein M2189_005487 [Bradyrhizobium japonicum]|nr:hypothetical protein [Bradyrhizobium japonicum]MCS3962284.1 hypothetical protein [Bradyrhizobium japonicum]MCS3994601.1 hypothetical protein [Bradyrhizobium japonicum]